MKHLFHITLLLALTTLARAAEFQIGPRRTVSLEVAEGWKAESKRLPGRGVDITLAPQGQENALCRITVLKSVGTERYSEKGVDQAVLAAGRKMLATALETEVSLQKLEPKQGYGVYASCTDKQLMDRPAVQGAFKTTTHAMVMLNDEFAARITLFADSLEAADFQIMLGMVNSLELLKAAR